MKDRLVLAIDPGLDRTGGALLRRRAGAHDVQVLDVHRCITAPDRPLSDRLADLMLAVSVWRVPLEQAIRAGDDALIALEVPEKPFTFSKHRGGERSERMSAKPLSLFWQALGAIRAGCAHPLLHVHDMSSTTTEKERRHLMFARYLGKARNQDERDAIVLGCRVLFSDPITLTRSA